MKDTYCPKCRTHLILQPELEHSKSLKCPSCKVSFDNPHYQKSNGLQEAFSNLTKPQRNWLLGIGAVIAILIIGSLSDGTSNRVEFSSDYDIESNEEKIYHYSSNSYDIEKNGRIITKTELTYHTFDFRKKIVIQNSIINGKRIEMTYPFTEIYEEKGIAATTYVLTVNVNGCKEIWWSPDVPNLGYDYDDGTRIACYELELDYHLHYD